MASIDPAQFVQPIAECSVVSLHLRIRFGQSMKEEQAEAQRPQESYPQSERYLLQIDRQSKRAFKTLDGARTAALEIKARFPTLQVSVYDSASKSRIVVDVPKSA